MYLRVFFLASFFALVFAAPADAQMERVEDDVEAGHVGESVAAGILATVDGVSITSQELEKEVLRRPPDLPPSILPTRYEEEMEKYRRRLLEDLVFQKLLVARCDKLTIKVTDPELNSALQDHIQSLVEDGANIGSVEEFFRLLEDETGEREGEARERLRQELRFHRLYRDHVYKLEFIAPQQLRAYYDAHREEFAEEATYTLRRIFIPSSNPDLGRILEQLKRDIAAGVDFAELVRLYYDGPLKDQGGLVVYTDSELADHSDPIPQVVRALKPGQISELILDQHGVRVFRLEERKLGESLTFEEAQERINKAILEGRKEAQKNRFSREIKENAEIRYFFGRDAKTAGN